jgi:hypothetical protein
VKSTLSRLKSITVVLSLCLMVLIEASTSGGLVAQEGEPSGDSLIEWDIDTNTGHLVAMFPHIAYRYHVETIRRGDECGKGKKEKQYLQWNVGHGEYLMCYLTMRQPGWVMWEKSGRWNWIGTRTKGKL